MKTYSQFITEADNGADLKKAVKKNGCAIPASFKYLPNTKIYHYYSKQGFRGETTVRGVLDKLEEAGWTKFEDYDKFTPDGSRVSYHSVLMSPDKSVLFKSNCSYGGTSWDNYYSAEFRLVADEEAELTKKRNFNEIDSYLKELGIRYASSDEMIDNSTWTTSGAFAPDIPKKVSAWKQVGNNEWEKGNCRVKYDKEGLWGKAYVSLVKEPEPIKLQ